MGVAHFPAMWPVVGWIPVVAPIVDSESTHPLVVVPILVVDQVPVV